jgi:hypothetical protein
MDGAFRGGRGGMIEGKETILNENLKTGLFYDNNPMDISSI